jgi:DNA/RNA-binding domain of Phe-tRNA-synthetase-like protein
MQIEISDTIKKAIPKIKLGIISADVIFQKYNKKLWIDINTEIDRIKKLSTEEVKKIPQIAATRKAYSKLGKEPSRYRPSAEALHRRIVLGKEMYQISNIVDTINLASLKTGFSIGGYDADKIQGNIIFDVGKKTDDYQAIGRGKLNIENLPVFFDDIGAFGSPTSDSVRTMITNKTQKILLIVMDFGNDKNFNEKIEAIADDLRLFCDANHLSINIL